MRQQMRVCDAPFSDLGGSFSSLLQPKNKASRVDPEPAGCITCTWERGDDAVPCPTCLVSYATALCISILLLTLHLNETSSR